MADPTLGLEDSDDDFQYEEVEVLGSDEEDDGVSEDLDAALRSLQAFTNKEPSSSTKPAGENAEPAPGTVSKRPEVIDDFMRNFFVKMGLSRTCEAFESEWYELKATGKLEGSNHVPDVYLRNLALEEEVAALRIELSHARSIAAKASATWDTFRKERDFHRMHHKRVAQEKNRLITDIRRLKVHYAKYEPTILELKKKYETAMKEKMLISLERDKAQAKMEAMRMTQSKPSLKPLGTAASTKSMGPSDGGELSNAYTGGPNTTNVNNASTKSMNANAGKTMGATRRSGWTAITGPQKENPYHDLEFPPTPVKQFTLSKTFKGHLLSVANVTLHPTKPILVTASDDKTWKMWHLPDGDLIMCGEGHKDWVAGVDFNPNGTSLASGGGDNTVKIWDFEKQRCVLTFSDHKQAVWGVKYHWSGDVLASCSLDHTVRLWDVPAAKCRIALRGHVDSVNEVCWQPFTSNLATASSDKTVSVWDARSGLCVQTFYGHNNSCNSTTFNLLGTSLASTDADGVIKLWDTRMVCEMMTLDGGKHPANKCAFDRTGQVLAVASDDGSVKVFNATNGEPIGEMTGHDDAVQAVTFDPAAQFMVSCGSDNTFRVWA